MFQPYANLTNGTPFLDDRVSDWLIIVLCRKWLRLLTMAEVSGVVWNRLHKIYAFGPLWTHNVPRRSHHVEAVDARRLSLSPDVIYAVTPGLWSLSAKQLQSCSANFEHTNRPLGMACWTNKSSLQCLEVHKHLFRPLLLCKRTFSARSTKDSFGGRFGYYDILKVSPDATQAQIKSAYYKQSFIFHPDRNHSDEAPQHFALISEAYNVLGNVELRNKYDRGFLNQTDVQSAGRSSPVTTKPKRPPIYYGKTAHFDFDAFYQGHYGDQIRRAQMERLKKEQFLRRQQEFRRAWKRQLIWGALTGFFVFCYAAFLRF
ncbi:hypothetical protein DNTS_009794 [Danionella cerebrum]|uniref:J domain-containing protein n=1 Tax=Danionella cerebrum TaxID=2873325 RepID=A0A553QGL6_9TELE|nr:hypothetical protein DNTS_009794 [Danionella translucida]